MKNWKCRGFKVIIFICCIVVGFIACDNGDTTDQDQTPTLADFEIGCLRLKNNTAVSITTKTDKTSGEITVYYNGSTTIPQSSGSYNVTFSVSASNGWKAAEGLSAGILETFDEIFDNVDQFELWVIEQNTNTKETPYAIALNINDLKNINTILFEKPDIYIILDLLDSTITEIPNFYFYLSTKCTSLIGIILPNSVFSIGSSAFNYCTNLTSVTIPNSVTSIGSAAFWNCFSLTNVTIPNSINRIEDGTFWDCRSLTSIIIPNSVTSIGEVAFACENLKSITIPSSVTSIGGYAFYYCNSLISVNFLGVIASTNFDNDAFYELGDLRDKFYATDANNGTPGIFKRPDGTSLTWIRQE